MTFLLAAKACKSTSLPSSENNAFESRDAGWVAAPEARYERLICVRAFSESLILEICLIPIMDMLPMKYQVKQLNLYRHPFC